MISIVKKKNKIKRELFSKIEWACSLNAIKLEHEMIFEGCLRIVEHTSEQALKFSSLVKIRNLGLSPKPFIKQ